MLAAEAERSLGANVYIVSRLRRLLQVEKFKCKTEAGVAREDSGTQKRRLHRRAKFTQGGKKGVFAELKELEQTFGEPRISNAFFFLNVISFVAVICE